MGWKRVVLLYTKRNQKGKLREEAVQLGFSGKEGGEGWSAPAQFQQIQRLLGSRSSRALLESSKWAPRQEDRGPEQALHDKAGLQTGKGLCA